MVRCPLLIFILLLTSGILQAQSFYQFQYNFQPAGQGVDYHGFLVLNEDNTGILRLRFQQAGQDLVIEADATEDPILLGPNNPDSLHTRYTFSNPRLIVGTSAAGTPLPILYFTLGSNGFIQPTAVLPAGYTNVETDKASGFSAGQVEMAALRKDFLLQYFSEDEDLFKSIIRPMTRGFSSAEKNTRLFLLLIANTNDATIGKACAYDKERMLQTFSDLSSYLGIRLVADTISGKLYGKKNAEAAIKRLNPSPNDILVFYYSGHGFRKSGNNPRFPLIDLREKPTDDYVKESMSMEDIYKRLKAKRARVSLVLSDCCNTEVTKTNAIASKPLKTKSSGLKWSEDNIRALFLDKTPLSILATAADAGQKATCNQTFGGFFSWFFKTSMESSCSMLETSPSWDEIFQVTQKQTINKAQHTYCDKPYTPENICNQTPVYKIEVGR